MRPSSLLVALVLSSPAATYGAEGSYRALPIDADFANAHSNAPTSISIYTPTECATLLRPILSPTSIIKKGLGALAQKDSNSDCLHSVLDHWEIYKPTPPEIFPNRRAEVEEALRVLEPKATYLREAVKCLQAATAKSPPYVPLNAEEKAKCSGRWLDEKSHAQKRAELDKLATEIGELEAERQLWKNFPKRIASFLGSNQSDKSKLAALLSSTSSGEYVDRDKLFSAFRSEACARLPYDSDEEVAEDDRGLLRLCNRHGSKVKSDLSPHLKTYRKIIPDVSALLKKWESEKRARIETMQTRIGNRQMEINRDYDLRRLLSRYKFFQRLAGKSKSIDAFCKDNEARLLTERTEAERMQGIRPFLRADQWRIVESTGISELEATGISSYTGDLYIKINQALREAKNPGASNALLLEIAPQENALRKGLERLPSYQAAAVTRFAKLPPEELAKHQVGVTVTYDAYTSASRKTDWIWNDTEAHRFVIYGGRSGKDVAVFSANPDEEEILFTAGTRFKILSKQPREGLKDAFDFVLAEVDETGKISSNLATALKDGAKR